MLAIFPGDVSITTRKWIFCGKHRQNQSGKYAAKHCSAAIGYTESLRAPFEQFNQCTRTNCMAQTVLFYNDLPLYEYLTQMCMGYITCIVEIWEGKKKHAGCITSISLISVQFTLHPMCLLPRWSIAAQMRLGLHKATYIWFSFFFFFVQ